MPKLVFFPADFRELGEVKFAAGAYLPLSSETQSLVDAGCAELVDTDKPDAPNLAAALQALADMAKVRSEAAISYAQDLIQQAEDAQRAADEAVLARTAMVVPVQTTAHDPAAARAAADALREAADVLILKRVDAGEVLANAETALLAKPKDAALKAAVATAKAANDAVIAEAEAAIKAADEAEQALQG